MISAADRDALARHLNGLPNNMFATTLRYANGPVSIETIRRHLAGLAAKVDRENLGRYFHRAPASQRCQYWAVGEQLDGNPHVHAGWQFPSLQHGLTLIRLLRDGVWEARYAPGGTHHHAPYDTSAYIDGTGWAGYALKAWHHCDHVMLSDHADIAPTD